MGKATVRVHLGEGIGTIRPELHGHFAEHLGRCVYDGVWVGEGSAIPNDGGLRRDVVAALRRLGVPVLRWPGGCFADDYHWEDGVGPVGQRPRRVNAWWGHVPESNAFGTHEFIRLCRAIGAEPYFAGNVGSGTPTELRQWVEYCNYDGDTALTRRRRENGDAAPFGVRWWGIGNENWGCGGSMEPEDYATCYRQFANYVATWGVATGGKSGGMDLKLIACGPNSNDHDWTRRFFTKLGKGNLGKLQGFAAHYYSFDAQGKLGTATEFSDDQYYELLRVATEIERLIVEQRGLMDEFDPERKIGLVIDEWGSWHPSEANAPGDYLFNQSAMRDGVLASLSLDAFHRHAGKLWMCNIAQVLNVLQAVILTRGDRMVLTPTYHVFEMHKGHRGGESLRTDVEAEGIAYEYGGAAQKLAGVSASASRKDGVVTITLANLHATEVTEVNIELIGGAMAAATAWILAADGPRAHNTFDEPARVVPRGLNVTGGRCELPPASVGVLNARLS